MQPPSLPVLQLPCQSGIKLEGQLLFFCSHDWGPESWLQPHFSWLGSTFTELHFLTCKLGPTITICCKGQGWFSGQLLHGGVPNRVSGYQLTFLLSASWWCPPLLHTPASWICTALDHTPLDHIPFSGFIHSPNWRTSWVCPTLEIMNKGAIIISCIWKNHCSQMQVALNVFIF